MLLLRRAQWSRFPWVRHHRTACACAAEAALQASNAEPGSVSECHQHVLVRLPQGAAEWGPYVEKDSSVFEAFKAIAKHQQDVSSTVKITCWDDVGTCQPLAAGTCDLIAFPQGVRYRSLPLASLGAAVLQTVADDPSSLPPLPKDMQKLQEEVGEVMLFVCCHGTRDARCRTAGPALASKLLVLVRQMGLQDQIRVYRTSCVGGHKFAGNVLLYGSMHPCDGDWFGMVNSDNAEEFLQSIVDIEIGVDGGAEDPRLRRWWRGRLGLSKEEQRELFQTGGDIEDVGSLEGLSEDDEEEEEWEVELEKELGEEAGGRERRRAAAAAAAPESVWRRGGNRTGRGGWGGTSL